MAVTKKLRKILVATDLSELSDYALLRAVALAKANHAELTILHVIEKKQVDELLDDFLAQLLPKTMWIKTEEYYQNLLDEKAALHRKQGFKINKIIIPKGKPAIKILTYAKRKKFDLLVIGSHGNLSIRDLLVGTNAEYIAEKTSCPVLIVKNKPDYFYNRILVPVDFSNPCKNALKSAVNLFPEATIDLLHAGDYEFKHLLKREEGERKISKVKLNTLRKALINYLESKMKDFSRSAGVKHRKISLMADIGYPGPIILAEAEKKTRNLIIMGTQGHDKKHYLFKGRVTHAILRETTKDVLLFPPSK